MSLSLEDIDARILSLRAEIDTTGSSLAGLDGDITLKLLASATLSGRTAAEWAAASPKLPLLWGYYGALKDKVAEIVALRGTRPRLKSEQLEDLTTQLLGDSVAVPPDPATPGARTLTTTLRTTSIRWVQTAMATMFQEIVSVVDRVGAAWTALPRLDTFDATLTGLTQTAGNSGIKPPAEIAATRRRIASLRTQLRADPLAADVSGPNGIDAIARQVAAAEQVLRSAVTARGELAGRLSAAAGTLDAIGALIEQAQGAGAEASQKIMGLANGAGDVAALGERLARLRTNLESITSVGRGNWQEATRLLGLLDQQVTALRDDATKALSGVRDPLAARNELRGRLDAYHAKALAKGLAEDVVLAQIYERAKALLFTAPCDVAGAEAAVRAYQQGLNNPGSSGSSPGSSPP